MYRCKILTDDFLARLEDYIQASTAGSRDVHEKLRRQNNRRRSMYYMWNNPQAFVDKPEIKQYYEKLGLWSPQYTEVSFVAAGRGLHIEPHITWMGQIRKISEVGEIFSYESIQ